MSTSDYDLLCSAPVADPTQSVNQSIKPQFEDITETEDIYGEVLSTRPTAEKFRSKIEKERYNDVAIVVRRRLGVDQKARWINLEIQSPSIVAALTKVCGDSSFLNTKVVPIKISKPYPVLFHYREGLREYARHPDRTDEEKPHLKVLIDFMAREFRKVEAEYNRLISKGQVTFPLVWTLFKPGEEVFIHDSHYVTCGIVHSLIGTGSQRSLFLGTRSWDYDGSYFGPVAANNTLKPFEGISDITSLPVYPVKFHKNKGNEDLRKKLIDRGHRWKQIVDVTHCTYEGKPP
jgi:hypothetical protein